MNKSKITFFVDYDNTISNNDEIKKDIQKLLAKKFDKEFADRFDQIIDEIREKTGQIRINLAFKEIAKELNRPELAVNFHKYFHDFDFEKYLYPSAKKVLLHLQQFGSAVIVTEGQKHYQLLKSRKSGIYQLVNKRVEVFSNDKPNNLKNLFHKYPADIYYLIEDKPKILIKVKELYGDKIQTVHVCQGHYSTFCDRRNFDLKIASFGDLLKINFPLQKP